jgi:hypothetical protein
MKHKLTLCVVMILLIGSLLNIESACSGYSKCGQVCKNGPCDGAVTKTCAWAVFGCAGVCRKGSATTIQPYCQPGEPSDWCTKGENVNCGSLSEASCTGYWTGCRTCGSYSLKAGEIHWAPTCQDPVY